MHGGGGLKCRVALTSAQAEEVAVVVLSELAAEEVKCKGIHARVNEGETKAENLEAQPEIVEVAVAVVVPDKVDVARQPAHDEDDDEAEDDLGHFLPGIHLALVVAVRGFALHGHQLVASDQHARHHNVEEGDD